MRGVKGSEREMCESVNIGFQRRIREVEMKISEPSSLKLFKIFTGERIVFFFGSGVHEVL